MHIKALYYLVLRVVCAMLKHNNALKIKLYLFKPFIV